ncbi:MAG: signal peptidase II [Clostridiales bacterium]|nr:signal peptidase II [Clostridiales bacterium]
MKNKIANLALWAVVTAALVWFDQFTKSLAVAKLMGQPPFVLLEGVFELCYSENRGAAFGILQGRQGFFFVIAAIVLAAAVWVMWRMPSLGNAHFHGLRLCVILITAGAAGNMIDRIGAGYVVDFFYFKLINFPVFNVADICVTTATALLLLLILFFYSEQDLECFAFPRKSSDKRKDAGQ